MDHSEDAIVGNYLGLIHQGGGGEDAFCIPVRMGRVHRRENSCMRKKDLSPETLYPHQTIVVWLIFVLIIFFTPFIVAYLHHGIPRDGRHSL